MLPKLLTRWRSLFRRKIAVGDLKIDPIWRDKPDWKPFKHVTVFAISNQLYHYSWPELRYQQSTVDNMVQYAQVRHAIVSRVTELIGPEGQEWKFMNSDDPFFFAIGATDDMWLVQYRLAYGDDDMWDKLPPAYDIRK